MTGEEMKAKKDGANETKAGNKKKKEVAAAKERDELFKKKLENAIATGRESLIRQALAECKEAGLSEKTTGGLMSKAEKAVIKGPHKKTDRVMASFELMSDEALQNKIDELKQSGKDPKLLAELEKTLAGKRNKAKTLKADLERAIQAKNIDQLEKAIDAVKQAGLTQADGPLEEAEVLLLKLLMDSGDSTRLEKRMRLAGKSAFEKAFADVGNDSPHREHFAMILAEKEREEDSIRKRLKAAIESGDKDALAKALQDAKKAGFTDTALIDQAETKYLEAAQDLSDAQRNLKKQAFQSSKGAVDKFAKSGKGGKGGRKKNMKEDL